jgi:two-component system LytT family response regulator
MVEGQKLIVSKTLKEIEMMLPEGVFFRIHNSFVANLQRVNKLLKSGGCSLLMENGVEIPVSRQRKDALLEKLSIH